MKPATWPGLRFTLAIIAGGQSRRMGRDKAFVELGGSTLIERVIQRSANLGQAETILITNKPADYGHLGLPMYRDALPDKGSLGGIYTALVKAKSPAVLVLACDMPFISADLLRFMLTQLDAETDIVAPRVDRYPQALHAIYRKTCIQPIRAQLEANQLKIIRFYGQMRVRYLDEAEYAGFDADGRSFANLNTPAELAAAKNLINEIDFDKSAGDHCTVSSS